MANKYTKIETDNPLLDEIVYNCKQLMSSCILKDEKSADNAETVESLRNANIYMSIIEGRAKFEYFKFTMNDYFKAGVSPIYIDEFMRNPNAIPESVKNTMIKNKSLEFKNEYVEINNYYRKLMGLPDYGSTEFVYLTDEQINSLPIDVDYSIVGTPVHLLPDSIKYVIEEYGILDELIEKYPQMHYLKYINKHIDLYIARKAEKFGLIYINSSGIEPTLLNRFKELLEKNRVYIMKTLDTQAYSFYSDYYDRFLMMMIIVQTVIDMINELPEYYIRRDIFDIRTIEYFFEANGVEFFPNIPLKYQKILVQNLNRLIKFKSTSTNIVDICSLFGFSNIEIFKYYLCKIRNIDEYGEYMDTGDITKDYELKFLKVPLEALADEAAKDQSNFVIYDTVISNDPYWNGPYSYDYVKRKILEHEFNMVRSKYISIDTVYSLTDASFELSYFINMIMFNDIPKNNLKFIIPLISSTEEINLIDAFIFLYALMYEYNGVTDNIIIQPSGYLKIKGFNFKADLTKLGEYVMSKGYSLQELGVDGFQIPSGGILTFNQLISIFINNKNIYNHIIYEMEHADNKEIYLIYKYLYDSLMLTDLNFEYYYVEELGRPAETYTEFLQYKNRTLYNVLQSIKEETDPEKKSIDIYNMITNISSFITDYIGSDQLSHIFINLPTESGEYVKNYMYKIINFFKSYKISILDIQTIYKLDKENKVFIFDDIFYQYYFIKKEIIKALDKKKYFTTLFKEDTMKIIDDYIFNSIHNSLDKVLVEGKITDIKATMSYPEYINVLDRFKDFAVSIFREDKFNITDLKYRYNYVYNWSMKYDIIDTTVLSATFNKKEMIVLNEIMDIYRIYKRYYTESNDIIDTLLFNANIRNTDHVIMEDTAFINPVY